MPSTTTPTTNGADGDGPNTIDLGIPTVDLNSGRLDADRHGRPRRVAADPARRHRRHDRRGPRELFNRVGRGLRFLAGVDEELMDKVKWERSSYTSLGAVVLATAGIAGFSMWFAINQATDPGPVAALLPAAIWFAFVLIVDRWIVTTRPTGAWQRWTLLVSRSFMAVLIGIVVAEPLVLRIFQTQIEAQVRQDRAADISTLESALLACNPNPADPDAPQPAASCRAAGYSLTIDVDPGARARDAAAMEGQVKTLRQKIAAESKEEQRLNEVAAAECVGQSGPGLTGRWGEGVNCRNRRSEAAAYARSHPIGPQQAQLAGLETQLIALRGASADASAAFIAARNAQIQQRLVAEPQVDDPIGLLERMAALAKLGTNSTTLWLGIILVRLLFITVDCAPVLMKVTSGTSRYDELVNTSLDDAVKTHRLDLEGKDGERAMRQEEQAELKREHAIRMAERRADAVEARAAAYERQARAGMSRH